MDSILSTIKKMLGHSPEDTSYDVDIIVHINSVLMTLTQIGVGPTDGFFITGEADVWGDFLGETKGLEAIKDYIFLKVKAVHDPPSSSAAVEAMARMAAELEWRIKEKAEALAVAAAGVIPET